MWILASIGNLKSISIKGVSDTGKVMLASPNWPERYPADTDVYYCITASAGRRVNMQFDWMDLETNCGYNCDYVRVRLSNTILYPYDIHIHHSNLFSLTVHHNPIYSNIYTCNYNIFIEQSQLNFSIT
jgi:hypothetical protein